MKQSFEQQLDNTSLLPDTATIEQTSYSKIIMNLGSCTIQTVLGYVCLDIVLAISLHYVQAAYKNVPEAANGVGLAYTIVNVAIIPMALGFNQSLNVHAAQALGMKRTKLSRNYLNLTFYIHILYFLPLCVILYFLKVPFSKTIADNPEQTSEYAWDYLMPLMISSIFAVEFECFKTYMIACLVFTPFIIIHLSTTCLHVLWCYLLIEREELKIKGACYSIIITEVLNCVLLALYMLIKKSDQKYFSGFTFKFIMFRKYKLLKAYLKSSLSIVVHVYADFFVFFLLTFLAMALSKVQLSAQIAFSNTSAVYFRIPISLSLALLTFVGGEMGMLRVKNAQRYATVGFGLFFAFALVIIVALYFLRQMWAEFYGPDNKEIQDELLDVLLYFLLGCVILDGAQGSLTGVLKGINRAPIVTYSTLIAYYVVGIPLVCVLTYDWGVGWGVKGIWLGFGVANAVLLILYIVLIMTSNWNRQAQQVKKKIDLQNQLQQSSVVDEAKITDSKL